MIDGQLAMSMVNCSYLDGQDSMLIVDAAMVNVDASMVDVDALIVELQC